MKVIDLDRQFVPWDEGDPSALELAHYLGSSYDDWRALLRKRRVVILAEAGSGKTAELSERARLQADDDKFSFYATVHDVAREGLSSALGANQQAYLAAWKASTQPAWFFVDSVDEAKLANVRLEVALRRLSDGIHGADAPQAKVAVLDVTSADKSKRPRHQERSRANSS
jgi:hypothetical protein